MLLASNSSNQCLVLEYDKLIVEIMWYKTCTRSLQMQNYTYQYYYQQIAYPKTVLVHNF